MKAPAATFAEATGLITALRRPTESEIARIWLLAYVRTDDRSRYTKADGRSSPLKRCCKSV